MPLTHAEIIDRISNKLQDPTNVTWADAAITEYIASVLKRISRDIPFATSETHPTDRWAPTRGTYLTDGTTREIRLTDWDSLDTVRISQVDGVEHPVDQSPKEFRNFKLMHKVLALELNNIPDADETVYVYPERRHILQADIGTSDTAGAVSTASLVGDTSLIIKNLGTGTINKYTKVTISTVVPDTTEYMVTEMATIAVNVATVKLSPALVKVNLVNDVVTLALADSTLPPELEEILIQWTAGELFKDASLGKFPTIPKGVRAQDWYAIGKDMITEAKRDLGRLTMPNVYEEHSRN